MFKIVLVVFCIAALARGRQMDLTRMDNSYGRDVVDAVIEVLRRTCIFDDTLVYLRRMAYSDTQDGVLTNHASTRAFNGGIWNVGRADFQLTQTEPSLQEYRDKISGSLFIQWSNASYSDLRKPLYSALAAQLDAILKSGGHGLPVDEVNQATLWSEGSGQGQISNFLNGIQTRENEKLLQYVDLAFILDSSASMTADNFHKAKKFVMQFIQELDIFNARVAVVEFSSLAYPVFGLDSGKSLIQMTQAVSSIPRQPGSTATHLALRYVRDNVFTANNGSRHNATKLVVLVTDGNSDERVATVMVARELRAKGVSIAVVPVGESIQMDEMEKVASEPACAYIQRTYDFNTLAMMGSYQPQLVKQYPIALTTQAGYTFNCEANITADVLPSSGQDLTVTIESNDGIVQLFGVASEGPSELLPNPAMYTLTRNAVEDVTVQIHVRDASRVLLNFRSATCDTHYNVTVKVGNHLRVGSEKVCIEAGLISGCGVNDYASSPFIITGAPAPSDIPSNLCQSDRDSFTAPYPERSDRYLLCRSGQMIVVYCEVHQVYDILHERCVKGEFTTQPVVFTRPVTTVAPSTAPPIVQTTAPSVQQTKTDAPPATRTTTTTTTIPYTATPLTNPCTIDNIVKGHFYFKLPENDRTYIHCSTYPGMGTVSTCPEHQIFSAQYETCLNHDVLDISNNNFLGEVPNPCIPTGPTGSLQYYPYPGDPHKFIQCDQYGDAYVLTCHGLVWDPAKLACIRDFQLIG